MRGHVSDSIHTHPQCHQKRAAYLVSPPAGSKVPGRCSAQHLTRRRRETDTRGALPVVTAPAGCENNNERAAWLPKSAKKKKLYEGVNPSLPRNLAVHLKLGGVLGYRLFCFEPRTPHLLLWTSLQKHLHLVDPATVLDVRKTD